mgnify:CR=1 FL=1
MNVPALNLTTIGPVNQGPINSIYATKLTLAELTGEAMAQLLAADQIFSLLTEELPLVDWHPLENLKLSGGNEGGGRDRTHQTQSNRRANSPSQSQPSANSTLFPATPSVSRTNLLSAPTANQSEQTSRSRTLVTNPDEPRASNRPKLRPTEAKPSKPPVSQLAQLSAQLQSDETFSAPLPLVHQDRRSAILPTTSPGTAEQVLDGLAEVESVTSKLSLSGSFSMDATETIEQIASQLLATNPQEPAISCSLESRNDAPDRSFSLSPSLLPPDTIVSPWRMASQSQTAARENSPLFSTETAPLSEPAATGTFQTPASSFSHPPGSFPAPTSTARTALGQFPPAISSFSTSPELSETLTDWVNETLKEQAHRHGVDMS